LWKLLKSKVFEIQKNGLKIGLKILLKDQKIIRTKISSSFEINNQKTLIYLVANNSFRFIKNKLSQTCEYGDNGCE
jgi:hypothetical protein